jgi:hypothetical protein
MKEFEDLKTEISSAKKISTLRNLGKKQSIYQNSNRVSFES